MNRAAGLSKIIERLPIPRIDDPNVARLEICGVAGDGARIPAIGDCGDHEIDRPRWPAGPPAGREDIRIGGGRLFIEGNFT